MMDNNIGPVNLLTLYIWEALKANLNWTTVNGLIPILPIQDVPKISDSGKNHIVFGFSENYENGVPQIRYGNLALRIIAKKEDMGAITTTISRLFETGDEAAANVNWWTTNYPSGALVGIRFTNTQCTYIDSTEASETEGGPVDGVVNISYRYVTSQTVKTYNGTDWV